MRQVERSILVRTRSSKGVLFPPAERATHSPERRRAWLENAEAGFASTQPSNRTYYRLILQALWPEGHGIPGPLKTEEQLRAVINQHRLDNGLPPYLDVFRRLRELQGDEGFTSIVKNGRSYQLQALDIGAKREKRVGPDRDYGTECLMIAIIDVPNAVAASPRYGYPPTIVSHVPEAERMTTKTGNRVRGLQHTEERGLPRM